MYSKLQLRSCPRNSVAMLRRGTLISALFVVGLGSAAAQPRYAVTDLGVLPGHASCTALRLNDLGNVVGYCSPASEFFNQTAFVWKDGVMNSVGKFSGGNYSMANAINAAGTITGDGDTGNMRPQSFVTTSAGLVNIFPNSGGNTHTLFISDRGWIGGYYTKSLSGNASSWKGAIWTPDPKDPRKWRTTDLPILQGGVDPKLSSSIPWAFNQIGQAAGWGGNDQIGQHAVLWNNDAAHSIVDLGTYPGDATSYAWGMNDLGQVVGVSHGPFASRPVLWGNDALHTPYALPVLPGDNYGTAHAINNIGHALGTSYYGTPGTWDATPARWVLWREGVVYELQTVLDAITGDGWTLTSANALNHLGQIAATATRAGVQRAVVLTPLN